MSQSFRVSNVTKVRSVNTDASANPLKLAFNGFKRSLASHLVTVQFALVLHREFKNRNTSFEKMTKTHVHSCTNEARPVPRAELSSYRWGAPQCSPRYRISVSFSEAHSLLAPTKKSQEILAVCNNCVVGDAEFLSVESFL